MAKTKEEKAARARLTKLRKEAEKYLAKVGLHNPEAADFYTVEELSSGKLGLMNERSSTPLLVMDPNEDRGMELARFVGFVQKLLLTARALRVTTHGTVEVVRLVKHTWGRYPLLALREAANLLEVEDAEWLPSEEFEVPGMPLVGAIAATEDAMKGLPELRFGPVDDDTGQPRYFFKGAVLLVLTAKGGDDARVEDMDEGTAGKLCAALHLPGPGVTSADTVKAAPGQTWVDAYNYGEGTGYATEPPTFEVERVDATHAHGVRKPSGRQTKVALDKDGGVRGYKLKQ